MFKEMFRMNAQVIIRKFFSVASFGSIIDFSHSTRYVQEGLDVNCDDDNDADSTNSPQALVSLLDRGQQSATMLRTSQSDLSGSRQAERKGLLWLLDEETICPGGSDESFLERLFSHYGDRGNETFLSLCIFSSIYEPGTS